MRKHPFLNSLNQDGQGRPDFFIVIYKL